jgi:hypothetical protein
MDRDFDEIILCIPGASFFILNCLHLPATFFAITGNTSMLLTVATPTVIMQLIAIIPILASFIFVIVFKGEILAEILTIATVGAFIYQGYLFWTTILPIMMEYIK